MHKKEFWILTNKCANNFKHENEAEGPRGAKRGHGPSASFSCLSLFPHLIVKVVYACVDEGCSASLTIASEKQT
jgi:hypothetical protein